MFAHRETCKTYLHLSTLLSIIIITSLVTIGPAQCLQQTINQSGPIKPLVLERGSELPPPAGPSVSIPDIGRQSSENGVPYTPVHMPNVFYQPKVVAIQDALPPRAGWQPQAVASGPGTGAMPDYQTIHTSTNEQPAPQSVGFPTTAPNQSPRLSEVSEDDIIDTTPISSKVLVNTSYSSTSIKPITSISQSAAPVVTPVTPASSNRTKNNINNEFSTTESSSISQSPTLIKTETEAAPLPAPSPVTTTTQFTLINKPIDQSATTQATNVFITVPPRPFASTTTTGQATPTVVTTTTQSFTMHPLLVYSIRYEIRSFDLMSSTSNTTTRLHNGSSIPNSALIDQHHFGYKHSPGKTLIAGLKNTIGLDFYYSPAESYIFWIDVMEEKIFRGTMANGIITNVNMIVQGGLASAEGLAVDWIAKNIYWVESTLDHIEVANMNGSCRRTLIAGDMESPRAISVDPRYGLMFWTDWDKRNPRIERATMSGDDRRKLVDIKEVNGGWPNGLTLDYDARKIYWIDANSDSIHVVDYEGKNHKSLLQKIKSLGHPFAITLFENNIYWTDWKTNLISTANKYNGSDAKEVQRQQSRLFDIKVFHPNRQPKLIAGVSNPCAVNNGNCSHLCLLSTNATRVCTCPHLMRLTQDSQTCEPYERVLLIGRLHEIRAVDITKPLYHIMAPITIPKVFNPRQFEYDTKSRSVFWADSASNEVKRAHIAGNNIETIIDVIIDAPSGLALDWISGNIYVTSAGPFKTGKIFISNLNGEYISVLMDGQQGVVAPKSVAVHPLLGLLFCIDETEASEPLIFIARMDGQNKRVIASRQHDPSLSNPSNLAVDLDANRVYWVNQANRPQENATIQYYDINRDQVITIYDEAEMSQEQRINPGVLCVDGDHLIISSRPPNETIIRAPKNNITDRAVYKTQMLDQILALRVYNASSQVGTNACSSPHNGGCSQLCVPTNSTHRTCKCTMGYTINPFNETECLGKNKFLIYSYNLGMKGISLEPNSSPEDYHLPPIHKAFRASSIDYVHRENLIYWVDNEEGSITRINRDTTNYQVIIQGLESEECIGIDWVAGNIYWLDPYYDIIEVARLNGTNRFVIISGDMDRANGIVVNALHGYLVWSDIGSAPKIETARLDGSNRSVVVSTGLMRIDDLTIDYAEDYIYWVDSTLSTIERIRVDGSGRQKVYSEPTGVQSSQHHLVSIAIYDKYLYVADSAHNQGSITRFNKNNSSSGSSLIQRNLGEGIRDIAIFVEQPMPSVENNPCSLNNGMCQDLCFYLGERGQKRCACSHGKLRADGHTCEPYDTFIMFSKLSQIDSLHIQDDEPHHNSPYHPITVETKGSIISLAIDYDAQRVIYSEMTRDQICSVRFNGTDRKVLVEKQSFVEGIAFTHDQLYWTSIQDNYISRLNTTSDGRAQMSCDESSASCKPATVEKLIKLEPDDKPRGIAVDSCSGYVYWTNWNVNASIQRANPRTNYKIESIIKTNIRVPNGIAIDSERRKLYWCDARLDKIETCNMDGTGRIVLISALPQHPFALAVWKDYIFWTDWLARGVFKADKYTGQRAVQIKKVAQRPMGIAVASPDVNTCVDPCATNNGGCPTDHLCEFNQNYLGEFHILCARQSQDVTDHNQLLHYPVRPFTEQVKPICSPDDKSCVSQFNGPQYSDIIRDSFERYRGADQAGPQTAVLFTNGGDKLSAHESPTSQTQSPYVPPKPSNLDQSNQSTPRTTINARVPPTSHQPSAFWTRSRTPVSTPLSGASSSLVPQIINTKPTTPVATSPPTNAPQTLPMTTPPPCKVLTSSPHTITPDALTGQECKALSEFKCYLSEKLICIPSEGRCDGNPDCPSKEDESDCGFSSRGQYNPKHASDWHRYIMVIGIILFAALAALFTVFGKRNRRRWFVSSNNGFNHSKMFEDNGTNIEISNPMFDEDDNANLMNCPFSIDLDETTTNFSNPLYERQILLVNDKSPKA